MIDRRSAVSLRLQKIWRPAPRPRPRARRPQPPPSRRARWIHTANPTPWRIARQFRAPRIQKGKQRRPAPRISRRRLSEIRGRGRRRSSRVVASILRVLFGMHRHPQVSTARLEALFVKLPERRLRASVLFPAQRRRRNRKENRPVLRPTLRGPPVFPATKSRAALPRPHLRLQCVRAARRTVADFLARPGS